MFRDNLFLQVMRPSLEDVQHTLNRVSQAILRMCESIPQWQHLVAQQRQQQKVNADLL